MIIIIISDLIIIDNVSWYYIKFLRIPVHRAVLYAASEYFQAILTTDMEEKTLKEIPLEGVSGVVLGKLIAFCYTQQITINASNAYEILASACLFRLVDVEKICTRSFFGHRWERGARLHLDVKKLMEFLGSDEIVVSSEEDVFNAIIRWIEYDPDDRKQQYASLIRTVRMSAIESIVRYLIASTIFFPIGTYKFIIWLKSILVSFAVSKWSHSGMFWKFVIDGVWYFIFIENNISGISFGEFAWALTLCIGWFCLLMCCEYAYIIRTTSIYTKREIRSMFGLIFNRLWWRWISFSKNRNEHFVVSRNKIDAFRDVSFSESPLTLFTPHFGYITSTEVWFWMHIRW